MTIKKNITNRKIGFWGLLSISVGQVVGAGIVVLTGIGVSITGYGVPWAFVVALGIVALPSLCIAALGAAIPATGGTYTYVRDLIGYKTAFFYLALLVAGQLVLATYAIGFAEYLSELVPEVNVLLVSVLAMTICYVANLLGVQVAARLQSFIVILLVVCFLLFIFYGVTRISSFAPYTDVDMVMPAGVGSFISAAFILRYGMIGSEFVSELGGESHNPARNIPLVMGICLIFVTILYVGIALVATGVLPLEMVKGKSLAFVAKEIFPPWLYPIFIVGGVMCALISSLNAIFSWCTKGLYMASRDGWFSERLAVVNRYGTPYIFLTVFFVVGMLPILLETTLSYITILGNTVGIVFGIIPALALYNLNTKNPKAYENAKFKLPIFAMKLLPVLALAIYVYGAYLSFDGFIRQEHIVVFLVYSIAAVAYAFWRERRVHEVTKA